MTAAAPDARAVELWLAQRRAWVPEGLPRNATEAGRRFRCAQIGADLNGKACALRHLQHAEQGLPTPCAGCRSGAKRAELLQVEQAGHRANRYELLDDAYLSQLGRMPDEVIARRAGAAVNAIVRARTDLGRPEYSGPRCTPRGAVNWPVQDWTESIHLLAARLWRHTHSVICARRELTVEPSRWDAAGLGQVPDAVLAERMALAVAEVAAYRSRCGLAEPAQPARRGVRAAIAWDDIPDLGNVPDEELARRLWVPKSAVTRARVARGIRATTPRRWRIQSIDWQAEPLGELPDAELARRLGVGPQTVGRHRQRLGIPVCRHRPVLDVVDWDDVPLGETADRRVAEMIGCSVLTVAHARAERGIEPWSPTSHIDWEAEPLGVECDKHMAARLGVNVDTVRRARRLRRIPQAPPIARSLDLLRERGELGAELAAWADAQRVPVIAGQWMLRALNGDFGTTRQITDALGERFTVVTLQRWADAEDIDPIGVRHRMRLEVIAGRIEEEGEARGRCYTLAGAGPRPSLDYRSTTLAEVFSYTPARCLDNGLLRHLFGWCSGHAKAWLARQTDEGQLVKRGRRAGAHYLRPGDAP